MSRTNAIKIGPESLREAKVKAMCHESLVAAFLELQEEYWRKHRLVIQYSEANAIMQAVRTAYSGDVHRRITVNGHYLAVAVAVADPERAVNEACLSRFGPGTLSHVEGEDFQWR